MNSQTYHQQEMEERVRRFDSECDVAVNHIGHLRELAKSLLPQLSCEPRDLKNRFLQCTQQLEELMYAITEFNLQACSLENTYNYKLNIPASNLKHEIITSPSHSNNNHLPGTKDSKKTYNEQKRERSDVKQEMKREDWRERDGTQSVNQSNRENSCKRIEESSFVRKERVIGGIEENTETYEDLNVTVYPAVSLPPQPKLDPSVEAATIISADGNQLWIVVDDDLLFKLMEDMLNHYKNQEIVQNFIPKGVCVYYDETESQYYFRALYIDSEESPEVFLVDTGECYPASPRLLRPLAPQFAACPLAHLCHLADVDQTDDTNLEDRRTEFLKQFVGQRLKIKLKIDENDGPSQALYVFLEDGTTINHLVQNISVSDEPELNNNSKTTSINNDDTQKPSASISNENLHKEDTNKNKGESKKDESNEKEIKADENINWFKKINLNDSLDYYKCPEYENAVEAVTGYSNRDEMDICKHYKGGDGCFKGSLCKKRHVKIHPDGWTLDKVSVPVKCRPASLPAPGTWHKLAVTHVDDTCRFYVHFDGPEEPMSLADLVDDMTRVAADSQPLKLEPALGELVSARFDGRYYRARVISADDKIEVLYIDYGNTAFVSFTELRPLEPRWLAMPVRAVPCWLAGVSGASKDTAAILRQLVLDRTMEAQIISRNFDELTVKLVDADGFDVAEQLAAFADVTLLPYCVEHDSDTRVLHLPA